MSRNITINIKSSAYAHSFAENELIHSIEYERAQKLVNERLDVARSLDCKAPQKCPPSYDTISIFGERGTGKTSFLLSLLKNIQDANKDVEVLDVVDPTMIEEKEHIFLLLISLIKEKVDAQLDSRECEQDTGSYAQRQYWNQTLKKLAKGLPTLDNIGSDRKTSQWHDHDFIMERGLKEVFSAFSLREGFFNLVNTALSILEKKAFVLALDDIDVDMHKGWDVLEMLRKYVNIPQVITLLSGNLKLYSLNVRRHQWEQLEKNKTNEPNSNFVTVVNELEGQYLLKVLRTENRIHLHSVLQLMQFGHAYQVDTGLEETLPLKLLYKQILGDFGIKGSTQLAVFRDYLLSLSVRSQIQFIKNNHGESKRGIESIEAFLSRMYAANIDVETAANNAHMLNLIIQAYIEKQPSTPELYLLAPSYEDAGRNACLTAFTILFSQNVKEHPFLIFDYFVRLGFIRNLFLGLNDRERKDFYNRTGLTQRMSLKNNVGLAIGISASNKLQTASHSELSGLAEKSKKSAETDKERIDAVIKAQANQAQAVTAYLPISILKHTYKNESKVYYSIYSLLATIAEVLQDAEVDEESPEERHNVAVEKIKASLLNLQQLRTYSVLTRQGDMQSRFLEDTEAWTTEIMEESSLAEDNTLQQLAEDIYQWSTAYTKVVPPYLIGKIATRLYYTVQKISEVNLGRQMHRIVMALLHATLIEEALEYYEKTTEHGDVSKINISNVVKDDKFFINNLQFICDNNAIDQIPFTMWMIRCPLLWAFTDSASLKDVKVEVKNESGEVTGTTYPFAPDYDARSNVYELLCKVMLKDVIDTSKPVFSGAKGSQAENTAKIMLANHIDIDYVMNPANSVENVINLIYGSGVFQKKPTLNQISSFRKNYHQTPTEATLETPATQPPVQETETADNPA